MPERAGIDDARIDNVMTIGIANDANGGAIRINEIIYERTTDNAFLIEEETKKRRLFILVLP